MNGFSEKLQKRIIKEFKLRIEQPISKDEFYEIYNRAKELYEQENQGEFLSPRKFALEYLGLTISSYKMVSGGYQKAKILKDYIVEECEIQELRKRIIYEEKLHKGDLKTYSELLEYYNKYFIPFMEKDFFEKVLDVSNACLKNIQPKKEDTKDSKEKDEEKKDKRTGVIKNEIVTDSEIEALREKVLREELLHKDDEISYEKFLKIYKKHFIPLSEEEFAKRILDINKKAYTKIKFYPDTGAKILSTVKIPENIDKIRKNIIRRENVHRRNEITYSRFNEILDNNYLPISRIDYANLILDISKGSFRSAKYDENRKMGVLSKEEYPSKEEIEGIRKSIIQTYRLHKGDKITYSQFLDIYNDERFYITLADDEFAKEMFDIDLDTYQGIKYAVRENAGILKNEKINQEEIENLKKQILKEFRVGQKINYDELEYIYNKYYIRLSIKEYADRVLDIKSIKDLKNKKYKTEDPKNPGKTKIKRMRTMIFLGDELEKLKSNIITSNTLYNGMEITRPHFMKLYQDYPHAFSYLMFGKLILGIKMNDTNALILGRSRKVRVSTNLQPDINEENKEKFIQNQDNRIEELLYEGKLPNEIADELMISQYDIDAKISSVTSSRKIDKEKLEKARVKKKLFSDITFYKMAIQLHMNINDVKSISKRIIAEEIQRYMNDDRLTFDEAVEETLRQLLIARGKIADEKSEEKEATKEEIKEDKKRRILTARARKLEEQFEGRPKQKESLVEYINLCKNDIKLGKFDIANIDVLEQSILFLDKDEESIEFFTRYCIKQGEYRRANGFLTYYLNDYSIRESEKKKLRVLSAEIKKAQDKSGIINSLLHQSNNRGDVKNINGKIVDVLELKRKVDRGVSRILEELM